MKAKFNQSKYSFNLKKCLFFRPPAARVSGVVQESPGTLEYEVALYREASPRSEDGGNGLTVDIQNEIPVDQAVPIGTKLQLRATINNESGKVTFDLLC